MSIEITKKDVATILIALGFVNDQILLGLPGTNWSECVEKIHTHGRSHPSFSAFLDVFSRLRYEVFRGANAKDITHFLLSEPPL